VRDDPVNEIKSVVVEGHHPLGVELAEWDLQPGPGVRDLVHAVTSREFRKRFCVLQI
jgi:hypothetical protein